MATATRPLLDRQREVLALRTIAASIIESINGRYRAHLAEYFGKLEATMARLEGEFADLNGEGFANEIRAQLKISRVQP